MQAQGRTNVHGPQRNLREIFSVLKGDRKAALAKIPVN